MPSGASVGVMHAQRLGLRVRVDVGRPARAGGAASATMLTLPLGPMTSFTKNAVSLIIGPQPASYQPIDPSSNVTCRWP